MLIYSPFVCKVTQLSLRKSIDVVQQDAILLNDTALHNIKCDNTDNTFEQVVQAAKSANIYELVTKMPTQWNMMIGERGLKLSGDGYQYVDITHNLLKDLPFVILDEATSALDTVTKIKFKLY